jgi:hypothetical protein
MCRERTVLLPSAADVIRRGWVKTEKRVKFPEGIAAQTNTIATKVL